MLLQKKIEERIAYNNFIAYVQLHEYEALLLSKPDTLSVFYPDKLKEISALKQEISGMQPEDINTTIQGAPSKRISKYIPAYAKQKTTASESAIKAIGLIHLRKTCPHFNAWITKLEEINS